MTYRFVDSHRLSGAFSFAYTTATGAFANVPATMIGVGVWRSTA